VQQLLHSVIACMALQVKTDWLSGPIPNVGLGALR
jgi:hypothetical protein